MQKQADLHLEGPEKGVPGAKTGRFAPRGPREGGGRCKNGQICTSRASEPGCQVQKQADLHLEGAVRDWGWAGSGAGA